MTPTEFEAWVAAAVAGLAAIGASIYAIMQKMNRLDLSTRKAEQAWINEQQRKLFINIEKQIAEAKEELDQLRDEHILCRQENAVLREQLREANVRIDGLEKRLREVEGGG